MYSFGIMLWEMLKMEKPFDHIQHKNIHIEMVIQKGARPKVDESWGPALTGFLNSCWHQDLTKRPSAIRASAILKREAAKALGGKELELNKEMGRLLRQDAFEQLIDPLLRKTITACRRALRDAGVTTAEINGAAAPG